MCGTQRKKLSVLGVLGVLKKYSDADHPLTQKQIRKYLESEYGIALGRKALQRNLEDLIDFGIHLKYREFERKKKDGSAEPVQTDWYYLPEFDPSELRLLIDTVLFSQHIPYNQRKKLIEKIEGLAGEHFRSRVPQINGQPDRKADNYELFLNIELLDEAIEKGKKVRFQYLEYGADKKLHPRTREDGSVREYVINPYQRAIKEGKYYLICNYDKHDDISNYRIDRMKSIEILNEPVKPFEKLKGANGQWLDLNQYMGEHPYMYSSDYVQTKFRITRSMINEVIDRFGTNVKFTAEPEGTFLTSAKVNRMAMMHFAQNFAPEVVVLSPADLAEEIKDRLTKAVEAYE